MRSFVFASFIGVLTLVSANAQETPRFNVDIGAGFTKSVGSTALDLNNGWNVEAGAGYNFSRFLGARLDFAWDRMGFNGSTLYNIGAPGGDVHIFSATVDPVVHLMPIHHVDFYVIGGGGLFHVAEQFSQPVAAPFGPVFGNYPGPLGVFSNNTINKPGFDVGAGIAFGGALHGKFFAEAKWDHVFLTGSHIDYVPVSFGFRW